MSTTIAIFIAGCSTIGIVVMVFQARHACRELAAVRREISHARWPA